MSTEQLNNITVIFPHLNDDGNTIFLLPLDLLCQTKVSFVNIKCLGAELMPNYYYRHLLLN